MKQPTLEDALRDRPGWTAVGGLAANGAEHGHRDASKRRTLRPRVAGGALILECPDPPPATAGMIAAARAVSSELTLGELINAMATACGSDPAAERVEFDFCGAVPAALGSWRGDYEHLAIGWRPAPTAEDTPTPMAVHLLRQLEAAEMSYFDGWKSGEFLMDESTPVHVDNTAECTRTGIRGVRRDEAGGRVIIETFAEPPATAATAPSKAGRRRTATRDHTEAATVR